jgi:hypothetical protein
MARALFGLFSFVVCLAIPFETLLGRVAPDPAVQPALERFLARPSERVTSYRARRILEGENPRFNLRATMEAITELSNGRFGYTVVNESGSDQIRQKVLRPLLETEATVLETGDQSRSALTSLNYEIAAGELAEPGVVKLFARPRRKDVALIDGAVFVTRDDADLVRIEGRMAKNPSFWTTRVNVVRRYDRVAGARVPVRLDSTAQIRFAGESSLSMTYKYEMVNGVEVAP